MEKILFFDIHRLEVITKCDAEYMIAALRHLYTGSTIPTRLNQKHKPIPSLVGKSFLLQPQKLFDDTSDIAWKAQYVRLAGRRDYTSFKAYNVKYLDLSYYTDIDINAIKHNPLLKFQSGKIYFKYEN